MEQKQSDREATGKEQGSNRGPKVRNRRYGGSRTATGELGGRIYWWDDPDLMTGNFQKNEFVLRVMDHFADQHDGPVGSDPPTGGFPRGGDKFNGYWRVARNLGRSSVGIAAHVDEQGILDEELSKMDPQEEYTAVYSVVLIARQAAEEGKENPKLAELEPLKPIRGYLDELPTITLRTCGKATMKPKTN